MTKPKFRAWCEVEVVGNSTITDMLIFEHCELDNGLWFEPKNKDVYHINEWLSKPMQFTGLKDKNGKEIYEGDILKGKSDNYINDFLSPVDFYAGSFHVTITYDLHMLPLSGFDTVWVKNGCKGDEETSLWVDEFEIVGNIYETPELLNK